MQDNTRKIKAELSEVADDIHCVLRRVMFLSERIKELEEEAQEQSETGYNLNSAVKRLKDVGGFKKTLIESKTLGYLYSGFSGCDEGGLGVRYAYGIYVSGEVTVYWHDLDSDEFVYRCSDDDVWGKGCMVDFYDWFQDLNSLSEGQNDGD